MSKLKCRDSRWRCFAACLLIGNQIGCGAGKTTEPMARVTGVVRYKGEPVENAVVLFQSEKGPLVSSGTTDDEGLFELTTKVNGDGAFVGRNNISITILDPSPEMEELAALKLAQEPTKDPEELEKQGEEFRKKTRELMKQMAARKAKESQAKGARGSGIPKKYANQTTSGLKRDVEMGEANHFEIDLTD
jgi:hypothetical protein